MTKKNSRSSNDRGKREFGSAIFNEIIEYRIRITTEFGINISELNEMMSSIRSDLMLENGFLPSEVTVLKIVEETLRSSKEIDNKGEP